MAGYLFPPDGRIVCPPDSRIVELDGFSADTHEKFFEYFKHLGYDPSKHGQTHLCSDAEKSTERSLCPLLKLDIWHDNQGDSPSWYLKTICVKDLNTGANYTFNCYNWVSAESGDGQIERELTVAENAASFKKVKQDLIKAK